MFDNKFENWERKRMDRRNYKEVYPVVISFTRVQNYKNGSLFERAV